MYTWGDSKQWAEAPGALQPTWETWIECRCLTLVWLRSWQLGNEEADRSFCVSVCPSSQFKEKSRNRKEVNIKYLTVIRKSQRPAFFLYPLVSWLPPFSLISFSIRTGSYCHPVTWARCFCGHPCLFSAWTVFVYFSEGGKATWIFSCILLSFTPLDKNHTPKSQEKPFHPSGSESKLCGINSQDSQETVSRWKEALL